jgi:hypothetical protein
MAKKKLKEKGEYTLIDLSTHDVIPDLTQDGIRRIIEGWIKDSIWHDGYSHDDAVEVVLENTLIMKGHPVEIVIGEAKIDMTFSE